MYKAFRLFCFTLALVLTTLSANAAVHGDVNGDGEVNIADINALIDMILAGIQDKMGDVNGDDEVNIGDVNAVIDLILSH